MVELTQLASSFFDVLVVAEDFHRATGKAVDVYEESELKPGAFHDAVLREAVAL